MANNGRVFISHSHDDNARCAPLLTALDAWSVDYFFDTQGLTAGHQLNDRIQWELSARDIMLRVCTAATKDSFWMSLEGAAFRGLQAEDQRKGHGDRRALINLILDGDYSREPFDAATLFIDTVNRPRAAWMGDLARALGVSGTQSGQRMTRRNMLGLGAAGAVALGSVALAGGVYTTFHPASANAAASPHAPGSVMWALAHAGQKKDVPPLPVIAGDRLYVSDGLHLSGYDLTRVSAHGPTRLWNIPQIASQVYFAPAIYGDALYASIDSTLNAVHAQTGAKLWTHVLVSDSNAYVMSSAIQSGETLVVLDSASVLHALRAQTGAEVWHASVSAVPVDLNDPSLPTISSPVLDGESVYVGSLDHAIYAVRLSDGAPRWKTLTHGKVLSSPAVSDGVVYVGSSDGYLYALDARDGSVKWKYLTGAAVNSSPAVAVGVVYVASDDHYLYTLDAATGKPFWRAAIGDYDSLGNVVVNTGPVTTAVVVTGDAVCVMENAQYTVRSYTRTDGALRWNYHSKDSVQNAPPIGAQGVIYFGSGDDTIYAFGA